MKEYFPHKYHARAEESLVRLLQKHGWEGYGIYWAIVEKIYQNDGYLEPDFECIAFDLRADEKMIKAVIEDFNLFQETKKGISSSEILENLKIRKEKSSKAQESAKARWQKGGSGMRTHCERNANAIRPQCEGNAIKEKKRKEKEIINKENKERNIAEIIPQDTPKKVAERFFALVTDEETGKKRNSDEYFSLLDEISRERNIPRDFLEVEFQKFWAWWTEPNGDNTQAHWQSKKTFEIRRRIFTWLSRVKDYRPAARSGSKCITLDL